MIEAKVNEERFKRQLATYKLLSREGIQAGLDAGAQRLLVLKSQEVTKTYKRPIPKDKNGELMWERTGAWLDSQKARKTGAFERTIGPVGKPAKYEPRLADLPTGADGKNRTNKAAENAAAKGEKQIARLVEREIAKRLRQIK